MLYIFLNKSIVIKGAFLSIIFSINILCFPLKKSSIIGTYKVKSKMINSYSKEYVANYMRSWKKNNPKYKKSNDKKYQKANLRRVKQYLRMQRLVFKNNNTLNDPNHFKFYRLVGSYIEIKINKGGKYRKWYQVLDNGKRLIELRRKISKGFYSPKVEYIKISNETVTAREKWRAKQKKDIEKINKLKKLSSNQLINTLKTTKDDLTRMYCMKYLGYRNEKKAIKYILPNVSHPHVGSRLLAMRALSNMKSKKAVKFIIKRLEKHDGKNKFELSKIYESLNKITKRKNGKNKKKWIKWWLKNKKRY